MNSFVSIIIVTHDSQSVLPHCIEAIDRQCIAPQQIIIIDSGSEDSSYLEAVSERENCVVRKFGNIGYAAANNRGLENLDANCDYILILNPDTFLFTSAIEKSLEIMDSLPDVAIVSGLLEGFDIDHCCKTGKIDSSGIFRAWYGRWYDRGQGEVLGNEYQNSEKVPALCGALMFCRFSALESELPELFDESFFMYKEDIDLCIRLSGKGWKLYYSPAIRAFHCRGWNQDRSVVPRNTKLLSAGNEVRIYKKHPSFYMIWAHLKYILVRYFHI